MPVEVKPVEKSNTVRNAHADGDQLETQQSTDIELKEAARAQLGADSAGSKHIPGSPILKRFPVRVITVLLIISLTILGYLERARLLAIVSTRTGSQAGSSGELAADHSAKRKVLYWQDPMHPAYKSNKPGKAPDCGMDLVPIYEIVVSQATANFPQGAFQISSEKQQLIGVQYGETAYKSVSKILRAAGRLAYDETKIARIHPKFEGWIEQVWVDFTGKLVEKGQPLISIYSPELLQTQQEFLLARRGREELAESTFRGAINASESLYQAARKRLELWDVTESQIAELEKAGKPTKTLTLYAPTDGFVLTRNAFPKQRITPETELYSIADLSTIWVLADIYEYEAPEIKVGQQATVTLSYFPGRAYRGTVAFIYPQLDNVTRTLKVRVEISNPGYTLKPDMFANVELTVGYGKHVIVPQEAVMDSGAEQMVFVAHKDGYFEPRKVQLGAKVNNEFIVLGGLATGERIVTSANFLIDSESKLKSAAGGMGMPGMSHGSESKTPATNSTGAGNPLSPSKQENHSPHGRDVPAMPLSKTEDHSQHQLKNRE